METTKARIREWKKNLPVSGIRIPQRLPYIGRNEESTIINTELSHLGEKLLRIVQKLSPEEVQYFLALVKDKKECNTRLRKSRERTWVLQSGHTNGLGRIYLKKSGNLVENMAKAAADEIADKLGGTEKVIFYLDIMRNESDFPTKLGILLSVHCQYPEKTLARLILDSGASVQQVITWAKKGIAAISDVELTLDAREHAKEVLNNVKRIAISGAGICDSCCGKPTKEPCVACGGSGKSPEHPDILAAAKLLFEVGGVTKKKEPPQHNVNLGVQVNNDRRNTNSTYESTMRSLDGATARGQLTDGKEVINVANVDVVEE